MQCQNPKKEKGKHLCMSIFFEKEKEIKGLPNFISRQTKNNFPRVFSVINNTISPNQNNIELNFGHLGECKKSHT